MGVRNYLSQLWALMPRGRAWIRQEGSRQDQTLQAISDEFSRIDDRALDLMEELDPRTTSEMLPEWEKMYDLPDPCALPPTNDDERRVAVTGKVTAIGRQDEEYFVNIATQMGLNVTITHDVPFEMGVHGMGDPVGGSEWRHVWNIAVDSIPSDTIKTIFQCVIERYKPAHTAAVITFGGVFFGGIQDELGGYLLSEGGEVLEQE